VLSPSSISHIYFGWIHCLHHQDVLPAWFTLTSWRWKHYIPPKRRQTAEIHEISSQHIMLFVPNYNYLKGNNVSRSSSAANCCRIPLAAVDDRNHYQKEFRGRSGCKKLPKDLFSVTERERELVAMTTAGLRELKGRQRRPVQGVVEGKGGCTVILHCRNSPQFLPPPHHPSIQRPPPPKHSLPFNTQRPTPTVLPYHVAFLFL
jgi:hypothetical protein